MAITTQALLAVMCVLSCVDSCVIGSSNWYNTWWFGCPSVRPDTACPDPEFITFYLHTRSNPTTAQTIDLGSNNLANTNFVASKPTKILIHGLVTNSNYVRFVEMRKEFLINGDYNLISVDWRDLAKGINVNICFLPADFNAKHVGTCTGELITALRQAGAKDIHVIGHSMGAHVAGVAANHVAPDVVNRVTGLDPADWFFTSEPKDHLRPALAHFVDVIHTQLVNFALGHVDFYLNGGRTQPGCAQTDPTLSKDSCSHRRALPYFTESINTATGFYGWQCPSYSGIYGGVCFFHGGRTVLMGNSANTSSRGVVQVKTNPTPPFAMGRD